MHAQISRRQLLAGAILTVSGGCLCQVLGSEGRRKSDCCHTPELDPGSYEVADGKLRICLARAVTLKRPPCAACFISEDQATQLIIVRSARSCYHAVSRLCTHARQVLSFVPERRLMMCNGFNHSLFHLDGTLAKGPAESALQAYACVVKGGMLEVAL